MQHLINNIYYVKVPEGSKCFSVTLTKLKYLVPVIAFNNTVFSYGKSWKKVPFGSYTIIGTGEEVLASEEMAKQVVSDESDVLLAYPDFANNSFEPRYCYYAVESIASLFTAHNVPNNILLLKKNN